MSREHLSPALGPVRTGLGVIALAAALAMATSACQSSTSKASVVGQDATTSASAAAVGAPSKSASASTAGSTAGSTAKASSSAPAAGGGAFKVGQQVKVGTFTVVVHKVTYPYSNDMDQPAAGKAYVLLDVEVTNNSGKSQDFSSGMQFGLKDASNTTYNETIVAGVDGNPPDGTMAAGTALRGPVAFQVPAGDKGLKFSFMADVVSGEQTYIDLGK